MSLPPNVIRIKRKRDDDAPVTFLQFDGEAKRHRSGSNWAYQRRQTAPPAPAIVSPREARPVIHVSGEEKLPKKRSDIDATKPEEQAPNPPASGPLCHQTIQTVPSRRFHISRALLKKNQAAADNVRSGVSKRSRTGPAIFVEKTRKKVVPMPAMDRTVASTTASASEPRVSEAGQTTKTLKKPGNSSRIRASKETTAHAPLPETLARHHEEDMQKIADELNKWVMGEIGANLDSMEKERGGAQPTSPFRPKAPAQRYRDRHPEIASTVEKPASSRLMEVDSGHMSDATEDEGDDEDWIIEEYIRIPLKAMASDVSPTDIGVLVLDGEEATALFYGPENDSDDDFAEDDEDENAENHYTADYPEDEVDSDDEYGRHAYFYRTRNASDDEEFDNDLYESSDDVLLEDDGDEDAAMARIKAYMRRHAARE